MRGIPALAAAWPVRWLHALLQLAAAHSSACMPHQVVGWAKPLLQLSGMPAGPGGIAVAFKGQRCTGSQKPAHTVTCLQGRRGQLAGVLALELLQPSNKRIDSNTAHQAMCKRHYSTQGSRAITQPSTS